MEDATYYANILRSRECAICGADRGARTALAVSGCSVCRGPIDDARAILALAKGGAKVACSPACLEVVLQEGLVGGAACPACGSPWTAAAPPPHTCRTCAKPLAFESGYVGLWQAGRVVTFCSPACLEMHESRVNPFCG